MSFAKISEKIILNKLKNIESGSLKLVKPKLVWRAKAPFKQSDEKTSE